MLAGAEIRRLTELADQRALDPSQPVYNPMAHAEKSKVESVSPVESARINAIDAADAVESERAERPKWTLDTPVGDETARDVLKRYCGGELSEADTQSLADYIKDNRATKPMVSVVDNADPLVQKVYIDQLRAGGHQAERHDSWNDDLAQAERARLRLDTASPTEDLKYWRGSDALEGQDRFHFCAAHATRIHDPVAFTVATARLLEHPKVKAALERPYQPGFQPQRISDVTIEEILDSDGHLACSGFQLSGDDTRKAMDDRRDFMQAVRAEMKKPGEDCSDPAADHERAAEKVHRETGRAAPEIEAISSFENGTITVSFQARADMSGYEVHTFYPLPPKVQGEG